jgi:hypothetical protein
VIERDGLRFYTAADINHGKVREAMRKVGDDLTRAQFPETFRDRKGSRNSGHPYGPHRPEDAPTVIEVKGAGRYAKAELVPVSPALLKQRARINHRAHEDAKR